MQLKLLDFTFDLFKNLDLSNVLIISVQHILKSNEIMFDYLLKLGLKPENLFILGKCYSSNLEVSKSLENKGIFVDKNSFSYDSHISFDENFEKNILLFLENIKKLKSDVLSEYKKIILLDDGGHLILLWDTVFENNSNVIAIEQTSSGYNKVKTNNNLPIINVARSDVKLKYESPYIADKVISSIKEKLNELEINFENVLVIGGGSIGSTIYKLLSKEKISVDIYDKNDSIGNISEKLFLSILSKYNIIIGTTGEKLDYGFNNIGKKVLVSASSSDREFSAVCLRKSLPRNSNPFLDLKINDTFLLNSGFPINFNGDENSVAPELIQLTRSLIFSAVCLASEKKYSNGLIDLNIEVQKKIINKFKTLI